VRVAQCVARTDRTNGDLQIRFQQPLSRRLLSEKSSPSPPLEERAGERRPFSSLAPPFLSNFQTLLFLGSYPSGNSSPGIGGTSGTLASKACQSAGFARRARVCMSSRTFHASICADNASDTMCPR